MKFLQGKPISPGYAIGFAFVHGTGEPATPRYSIRPEQVGAELRRFQEGLAHAHRDLERLQARVRAELGDEEAGIFSAHLALLEDRQFIDRVRERVRQDLMNAEQAVAAIVTELADTLRAADNEYLREREQDIRDLGRRLLGQLARHAGRSLETLPSQSILIACELLPSEMLELDLGDVAGIITEQGGATSHAAILARSLGIPAITGIRDVTQLVKPRTRLAVDGQTGRVWIDPPKQEIERFGRRKARYYRIASREIDTGHRECVTRDGVHIRLYANIGRHDEAVQTEHYRLEGIGLFRTEYLFLDEREPPSLDRHREAYRYAAELIGQRPIVIRTLDLGGDKRPAFLEPRFETNPNLGMRGLRFSLTAAPDLFRIQLRAIVAVADRGVRILFPMVLGSADLRHAIGVLREEIREQGGTRVPALGALIETPSAVFMVSEILEHVDFLSIGTNDLTQFMLAADRNALEMMEEYTVLHPAVLRAIRKVVEAAEAKGRPVSVCGEAAADPRIACLLVGLGVRELSMAPASTPYVRRALRAADHAALERLARTALACESAEAVQKLIANLPDGSSIAETSTRTAAPSTGHAQTVRTGCHTDRPSDPS